MPSLGDVVQNAVTRVRAHAPSLLLAAAAAGLAFALAGALFGAGNAVFAPVAAVVATGLAAGQRIVRAVEISLGVVLGITMADLLISWLGAGPLQLSLAVLAAMAAAVAVRPSGLVANQAAVAAVVVIALVPLLETEPWVRFVDALIGGLVAVGLNAVAAPDPYRAARVVTAKVLEQVEDVLARLIDALDRASLVEAEAALDAMSALDGARGQIGDALAATRERLVWRPSARRGRRAAVEPIIGVSGRVVILLSTTRGLCRAAANLIRQASTAPRSWPGLVRATEQLTDAVAELRCWTVGEGQPERVRELALAAAVTASAQLPNSQPTAVFVGQLRSAAVDLLRATGLSQAEAVATLEHAAGKAGELGTGDTP